MANQSSNLKIRKAPGTDQAIVEKAARGQVVTILNKTNEQWSLIQTDKGEQGYVYNQYLQAQ